MTAPLRTAPCLSAVPASQNQNTAPVAEFRCLFTHDLRRKQKRWQDGFLKFHTFNKRVMVYDETRNFVGDTHWKDSDALHEGDELTLDKGVMVEVADAMGVTQTDLTPLFEKKSPDGSAAKARSMSRPQLKPTAGLRHKSLNSLLGTPKGPIGKSVPQRSPFEARMEKENAFGDDRVAKRQKTQHEVTNIQAQRAPQTSSPIRIEQETPIRMPRVGKEVIGKVSAPARPMLQQRAEPIVIDSTPDYISSEVTLPSPPPGVQKARKQVSSTHRPRPVAPTSNPVMEVPVPSISEVPEARVSLPQKRPKEIVREVYLSPPPPEDISHHVAHVGVPAKPVASPPRNPKAKSLRLAAGTKRAMLYCQEMPQQRSASPAEAPRLSAPRQKSKKNKKSKADDRFEPIPMPSDDGFVPSIELPVSHAPAVITKKRKSDADSSIRSPPEKSRIRDASPELSSGGFEEIERIHGMMDEPIVPKRSIERNKTTATKSTSTARTLTTKPGASKKNQAKQTSPEGTPPLTEISPVRKNSKSILAKKANANSKRGWQDSPPILPPPESPGPTPPSARAIFQAPPRRSASPSKPALSTGGFRKKSKKNPQPPATPPTESTKPNKTTPNQSPPTPAPVTKNPGLLLKASELSAQLHKPSKRAQRPTATTADTADTTIEDDPIEDASQAEPLKKTPSLRRNRSENDADAEPIPIPSVTKDWERKNLPLPLHPPFLNPNLHFHKDTNDKSTKGKAKASGIKNGGALAALVKKTDPRTRTTSMQRTKSLTIVDGGGGGAEEEVRDDATPPPDTDMGPWSTEAFDLFDWRPPHSRKEKEKMGTGMLVDE